MNAKKLSATQVISFGFAALILVGGLLLSLPEASRGDSGVPFLNSLFTSASATCVTGLAVYDIWTQFSYFGQAVILLLIQIGGLGFMAVAILFSLAVGRRIGLRERSLLAEAVGYMQVGGVVRLVRRMLIGTAFFEGIGTLLLATRFVPIFGFWRGIWFSLFHSVSAFCNAGFDLMGVRSQFSSLTSFYDDPVVLLTVAVLIMSGGIGFVVWNDLIESRFRFKDLHLHTKVVLFFSLALLLAGTAAFFILEYDGSMRRMDTGTRVLSALFQSITPRTAGFSSIDIASMSDGSKFVIMLLMLIGAAPGGTGGGIKVTTFAVIVASVAAQLRAREDVNIFHFRLEPEVIRRAFSGAAIYLAMTACGILILCAQGQPLGAAAFESLSAIGTVGLTVGITPELTVLSKITIILLMYAGRVGSLAVFMAVVQPRNTGKLKNPVGKIIVG